MEEPLKNFIEIIEKDNSLTQASKKYYISKTKLLIKKGMQLHSTEEEIIENLKKLYENQTSYKSMIYSAIKYREITKLPVDTIKEEYSKLTKKFLEKQLEQQSDKPLPTLEELKKCNRKISSVVNPQFKLIFSLYTEHPPVRNDFYDLKYKNYDTNTDNYYDTNTKKIILNRFKTSKNYDPIEIELSKKEKELVNKLIKNSNSSDDFVFHNTRNDVMDSRGFTEMLNREFKKICGLELGSSDLRKIYVSSLDLNNPLKEKKEIADLMGHSVYTQELHYKKYS